MADTPTGKATRREFMTAAGTGIVSTSMLAGFPAIVPASVLGANAPGNRINVGAIGTGRIARGHDMPGIWTHDDEANAMLSRPQRPPYTIE